MGVEPATWFWLFLTFAALVMISGLYCFLVTFNLLRMLIGLEIIIKGVTLLIIAAGFLSGQLALAQAIVITVIVIEVVIMVVAAGLIINFHDLFDSLNVKNTRSLKG
ncbi:MAG: NADH-quinone oxidoreductase subunit K [Candidatus Saganbacteria bacterium]|nr:NADH-quinone oxidoreductase subunit K [Candidatus Saganbacteria bacterium]